MQSKVPNIEIGKTAMLSIHNPQARHHHHYSDVLCVSWGSHILVYRFIEGVKMERL